MNGHSRTLALALIGWCQALLPADRALWAAAMKAEVGAIEDGNAALAFAAGCVWGSTKERMLTMAFAARSVRIATISGMLALSLQSALITGRMIEVQASTAVVFGLISALFAAAAVWSYQRGPMALVQTAGSMIFVSIVGYAFVSTGKGMVGKSANATLYNATLYEALAIEGVLIWAALLIAGMFMLRVEAFSLARGRGLKQ